MLIDGTDSFVAAKPDGRLIKLLRARRFHATLVHSDGVPFAALAVSAGPILLGSFASAFSRRISPKRSQMGISRAI
jgi:hypothetical protein